MTPKQKADAASQTLFEIEEHLREAKLKADQLADSIEHGIQNPMTWLVVCARKLASNIGEAPTSPEHVTEAHKDRSLIHFLAEHVDEPDTWSDKAK